MIPIMHSWSEGVLAILALAAVLVSFERRLARLESRIDMILRFIGVGGGERE